MWKTQGVENGGCGKRGVWKPRGVENAGCGKRRAWKTRGVENAGCGNAGCELNYDEYQFSFSA